MPSPFKIPFYAKIALIFIAGFALVYLMKIGEEIIVPLVYAMIISILLNPLVNYLIRLRFTKIVAISIVLGVSLSIFLGGIYLLSSQLTSFGHTYPALVHKFNLISNDFIWWISDKFNIQTSKINSWIVNTKEETIKNFEVGKKLTAVGQLIITVFLLPVYVFMILYYKTLLLEFIGRAFRMEHHLAVGEVLIKTKKIIQSYLVGLFFEMIIVAVLNTGALFLLGIEYAIILGICGAVLNIIPYLGGIVSIALFMLVALVTKSPVYVLYVAALYLLIQFIDNNYIIPKIVASRVKINALISVIAVLIGGAIWGIGGMFLSIPLTAILKVIFDHIEPLKPWGFLLGDMIPTSSGFSFKKLQIIKKKDKNQS